MLALAITSAVSVVLLILAVVYIVWLRHQLRNTVITSNGLYNQLIQARELRDDALKLIDARSAKNKDIEAMVSNSELSKAEKIAIISRLK